MFDRIANSRHFATFLGSFAFSLGIFTLVCLVIGVAVVLDAIVGVFT